MAGKQRRNPCAERFQKIATQGNAKEVRTYLFTTENCPLWPNQACRIHQPEGILENLRGVAGKYTDPELIEGMRTLAARLGG